MFPSNAATVSYFKFIFCKITFIPKIISVAVTFSALCVLLPLFRHVPPGSIICLVLNKITQLTNYSFFLAVAVKMVKW